jgi:MFS family permease
VKPRAALWVVFATILIDFVGFSVLIPVLPLYADRLGANAFEVAAILAVYAIAQLLFLPAWGWASDRFGRRPVILISLAGTTFAFLLLSIADTLWLVYLSRVLGGLFAASIGAAQAVVTDVTPPSERASGMGKIGAAFGLSFVVGPMLGGLLGAVDERLPFHAVSALAFANLVVAWICLPESRAAGAERPRWRELRAALVPAPLRLLGAAHDRHVALYLHLFFVFFAAFASLEAMFTLFLGKQFGLGEQEAGLIFAWIGLFLVATQGFLVGRVAQRVRESTLVIVGLFAMSVGMLAIAWAPSYGWLWLICPVIAVGNGLAFPAFTSLYSQACHAHQAGELLGQSQSMATTGRIVGALGAGLVMHWLYPGAPFLIAGLVMGGGLVLFVLARSTLVEHAAEAKAHKREVGPGGGRSAARSG